MKKLLTLTLVLTLAAATIVTAQPGRRGGGNCDGPGFGHQGKHHGMGMRDGAPGLKMVLAHGDEIGLTEQQRDQLEKMSVEFQTQRVDQKAELEKAQIKLKALMRDEADEGQVMAGIDNVSKLKADMQKVRYKHHQQVKSVLTEDQVDKLKDLRKDFRKNMKSKPGGHGRHPGSGGFGR